MSIFPYLGQLFNARHQFLLHALFLFLGLFDLILINGSFRTTIGAFARWAHPDWLTLFMVIVLTVSGGGYSRFGKWAVCFHFVIVRITGIFLCEYSGRLEWVESASDTSLRKCRGAGVSIEHEILYRKFVHIWKSVLQRGDLLAVTGGSNLAESWILEARNSFLLTLFYHIG